ncbi:6-pyruvoyl trahydropterin synthase family protein [Schleiferia thermophila]|jgi:6-pyruvoyltetrahydropterin/6-carboxytetrahydropterin synthase|uniref:6-carboxy-5,6,7,8-tetrahydropterin synthase n=1 Tax=Schleiferia thermophila TaxID=884107 RepID=A0A369A7Y0_9FLAO|nr:6-carboxytetrahydropterin synthase [Schleiferia thermophila]KFD39870.1 6-pyruvoyl tetrahydrobiopterin synthase [Schleiferia thermophila str. Yellowstone]RCX05253.1 6-pyruvoyltetrahydropterin/6-carboxytetrahydropterin synthase [Schleiferia thermophila]GCD79237.1 6-carboxy-5,6,7,8-tetrahydropterin synthase [Schleiferia thermophila]
MKIVTVSRRAHFNAAHRLHNPNLDQQTNEKLFGLCNNEYYHGHNYELIVSVKGPIDPVTGYVMDLKTLSDVIKSEVEDKLDHKNLNLQVEEFKTLNPTAENIAVVIYGWLRPHIPQTYQLKITLYETPRNFVEYSGEEN